MNLEKNLESLINGKKWYDAIEFLDNSVEEPSASPHAYITAIYTCLDVLLEKDCPLEMRDFFAAKLKQYFFDASKIFSENPEYLFFVAYFMGIAEWYFDQDDLTLAEEMHKKSHLNDPDNLLYKWGLMFTKNEKELRKIGMKIMNNSKIVNDLKSRGQYGKYILEVIERSSNGADC